MSNIPYTNLRPDMVFHSHCDDLIGRIIQWAVSWGKPKESTENHSGFIWGLGEWLVAAEVDGSHFRQNSLEKYAGNKNRIISVYDPIIPDEERSDLMRAIGYKLRKDYDKPYDVAGAVSSAPLAKKFLWFIPGLKENPKREFCSEVVYKMCRDYCPSLTFPLSWKTQPPNPSQLADWQYLHPHQWRRVSVLEVS